MQMEMPVCDLVRVLLRACCDHFFRLGELPPFEARRRKPVGAWLGVGVGLGRGGVGMGLGLGG